MRLWGFLNLGKVVKTLSMGSLSIALPQDRAHYETKRIIVNLCLSLFSYELHCTPGRNWCNISVFKIFYVTWYHDSSDNVSSTKCTAWFKEEFYYFWKVRNKWAFGNENCVWWVPKVPLKCYFNGYMICSFDV